MCAGHATRLNPRAALDALCTPGKTDGSWVWFHLKRGHPSLQACLRGVPDLSEVRLT